MRRPPGAAKPAKPAKSAPSAQAAQAAQAVQAVQAVQAAQAVQAVQAVDSTYLQSLIGYNARRAALAVIAEFLREMAVYGLRPVDFSVLSVIHHNPGVTSRQLCGALNLLPPNLVGLIRSLHQRALITRLPHPSDGRAMGLHLTPQGQALMQDAEQTATALEDAASAKLSAAERKTLLRLLQKIYL